MCRMTISLAWLMLFEVVVVVVPMMALVFVVHQAFERQGRVRH